MPKIVLDEANQRRYFHIVCWTTSISHGEIHHLLMITSSFDHCWLCIISPFISPSYSLLCIISPCVISPFISPFISNYHTHEHTCYYPTSYLINMPINIPIGVHQQSPQVYHLLMVKSPYLIHIVGYVSYPHSHSTTTLSNIPLMYPQNPHYRYLLISLWDLYMDIY